MCASRQSQRANTEPRKGQARSVPHRGERCWFFCLGIDSLDEVLIIHHRLALDIKQDRGQNLSTRDTTIEMLLGLEDEQTEEILSRYRAFYVQQIAAVNF